MSSNRKFNRRPQDAHTWATPETISHMRHAVDSIEKAPMAVILGGCRARMTTLGEQLESGKLDKATMSTALLLACEALAIFDRLLNAESARRAILRHGAARDPNMPPGDTKVTLVADLEAQPQSEDRDQLIAMAKAGVFHDFDSELATPKVALSQMLDRFGFTALAEKTRQGGYDNEHASVEQLETIRQGVGPGVYDAVMGEKRDVS